MTEQYRVYDRQTLSYVDGGVIREYKIDTDYMTNNASEVTLTEETYAKKGDIIVGLAGLDKTFIGAITAVDNTKKTITFKNMKELLADTVINPFKYTSTLRYKFELVGTLELILNLAFIITDDTQKKLPLVIEKRGTANGAVWTDDSDTLNISDFIAWAFDKHNVYLDFDIDFTLNKLVCRIVKNTTTGYVIKDNIKLSTPTFDKNELPNYNKAVVYNPDTGSILGTYYLLLNNTIKTKLAGIETGAQVNRVTSVAGKTGAVTLTKSNVGLANVDNTADLAKPISTATQTALNGKVDKVTGKQLSTEDYTTTEKSKLAGIETGAQVNKVTSVAGKTGAVTLAKGDVGLGNVDNTADSAKNVLSASRLTTARTISLTGAVTGSVSFNGSANVSITTSVGTIAANKITITQNANLGNATNLQDNIKWRDVSLVLVEI